MTRPIGPNDDDTVVEPLPDTVLEAVAGGESSGGCCCSCVQCSMGPDLEPTLDTIQA
jgi:hypothetical protein